MRNGAGKTTALLILTTLSRPDGGWAQVAGHDVVREAAAVQRNIGVAAQDATVDEVLTGRQNLVMIGRLSGLRRRLDLAAGLVTPATGALPRRADDRARPREQAPDVERDPRAGRGRRLRAPVRSKGGLASTVVRALDAAGITVDDVEVRQPSLDDVFFALTGRPAELAEDRDEAGLEVARS